MNSRMTRSEAYPVPSFAGISYPPRPVRLCITGEYEHFSSHTMQPRLIDEYVLILCTDGNAWVKLDGAYQTVHTGELLFLPANVVHSYGSMPGEDWSLLWFHCAGDGVGYFYDRFFKQYLQGNPRKLTADAPPQSYFFFQRILAVSKNITSFPDLLQAEALLYQFFCMLAAGPYTGDSHDSSENLVLSVRQWMENTQRYDTTLDDLSTLFGVSKYHLIRLFKRYLQTTPMDYFQQVRLNKSCSLLAAGSWSVTRVAEQLGYSSPYHFSKMFKNHFGISPREFKNLLMSDAAPK